MKTVAQFIKARDERGFRCVEYGLMRATPLGNGQWSIAKLNDDGIFVTAETGVLKSIAFECLSRGMTPQEWRTAEVLNEFGFEAEETGGGCEAWILRTGNAEILITDGDAGLPIESEDSCVWSRFDSKGKELRTIRVRSLHGLMLRMERLLDAVGKRALHEV